MSATLVTCSTSKEKYHQIGTYKYNEKDQIGEGFSSKVYKGINISNHMPVAIKVINSEILSQEIHNTLLQSQLKILEIMKGCQNVLEMHSIITKGLDNYIITQICTTDLSKIIVPILPIDKIQLYFQQLINGFQQLFRREIIHRDLKPANLLIDSLGNLKIADFGFAIKITEAKTQIKFNIGSPLYMSPQALKRNQYSYKSDIWAIGVILYEMLTGDTPWRAENQQQLYEKLQKIRIDHLLVNKKFPEHLKQFLRKALQFDKKYRMCPEQLIRMNTTNKTQQQNTQIQFQKEQILKTVKTQNNLFIPRLQKSSKTEKFYKAQMDSNINLCKTSTSIKQDPVTISIKPVTKFSINQSNNNSIFDMGKQQPKNNETYQQPEAVSDEKQTTHSSAKTNGSTTLPINQQHQQHQIVILTKQLAKNITNNLVYYVHICRLLYKIIVRLDQCIQMNFNNKVIELLANIRDNLLKNYCHVIVKYMYKVKNFPNNNFIQISKKLHQEYILTSQYKKLRKVCGQYIERYSKSEQLKYLWVQRQEPDFKACLDGTRELIRILWPQLCQKNHNEVILLEFILFAHEALESLEKGSHQYIKNKNRIQDYVDTIPNPPSFNRFKQAIAGGKKISTTYPVIIKQQKQQ